MMSGLTIKPFEKAFQAAARNLILQGMGEHWGWVDEQANPDIDDIDKSYRNGHFITVFLDNQLVGTGGVTQETQGVFRIQRMSVLNGVRRSGIGTQILDALVAWIRDAGGHLMVLETSSSWMEVIKFYENYGFTVAAQQAQETHFELRLSEKT